MTTRKIKLVKRDAPRPEPAAVEKPPADPERGIKNTVKDWITERRENSRQEQASINRMPASLPDLPDTSGNAA